MYDKIAHGSTNLSHIHRASLSLYERMTSIAPALKALRNRTTPKISSRDVATALDIPPSTYAAYEDPKKFKKPVIPFTLARKLVPIFAERGILEAETLALAGVTGELHTPLPSELGVQHEEDDWVEVMGAVAAGRWLEQTEWAPGERYDVKFGPPPVRGAKRFGVRMDGLSMNRTIQPGSDLECLWVKFSPIDPRPGDLVIVERTMHNLTEMTCKRLDKDGDDWILRCESTEEEFQDIIRIGQADANNISDDNVRVIGIVLSAKLDLAPAGLSQRRYRRAYKG